LKPFLGGTLFGMLPKGNSILLNIFFPVSALDFYEEACEKGTINL